MVLFEQSTDRSIDEHSRLIHDLVQQHVVEHFGYHDVNALRTALYRFPEDPVVNDAFYGECAR